MGSCSPEAATQILSDLRETENHSLSHHTPISAHTVCDNRFCDSLGLLRDTETIVDIVPTEKYSVESDVLSVIALSLP